MITYNLYKISLNIFCATWTLTWKYVHDTLNAKNVAENVATFGFSSLRDF